MVFIECPKQGIVLLLSFGRAIQYLSKFQNICYGAQCISRIPCKGYYKCIEQLFAMNNTLPIVQTHGVQYKIQLMKVLVSLFHKAMQYPSTCQKICYGA